MWWVWGQDRVWQTVSQSKNFRSHDHPSPRECGFGPSTTLSFLSHWRGSQRSPISLWCLHILGTQLNGTSCPGNHHTIQPSMPAPSFPRQNLCPAAPAPTWGWDWPSLGTEESQIRDSFELTVGLYDCYCYCCWQGDQKPFEGTAVACFSNGWMSAVLLLSRCSGKLTEWADGCISCYTDSCSSIKKHPYLLNYYFWQDVTNHSPAIPERKSLATARLM